MFDKGLREELTVRERHEMALECSAVRRRAIRERAVIALCDRVLAGEPDRGRTASPEATATVVPLLRGARLVWTAPDAA